MSDRRTATGVPQTRGGRFTRNDAPHPVSLKESDNVMLKEAFFDVCRDASDIPPEQKGNVMMTTYHATSSFYGSCGHAHRTIEAAERCAYQHRRALAKNGSYGNRQVQRVDGERLSDDEMDQIELAKHYRMTDH